MPGSRRSERPEIPKPRNITVLTAEEALRFEEQGLQPPYAEKEGNNGRWWCRFPDCKYYSTNLKGNVNQHYREKHLGIRDRSKWICQMCDTEATSHALTRHHKSGVHENGFDKKPCSLGCSRAWFGKGGRTSYHVKYHCPRRPNRPNGQHNRVWNPLAETDPSAPTFIPVVESATTASRSMPAERFDFNAPLNEVPQSIHQTSGEPLQLHADGFQGYESFSSPPGLNSEGQFPTPAWNSHQNNFGPPLRFFAHPTSLDIRAQPRPNSYEVPHGQGEPPSYLSEHPHPRYHTFPSDSPANGLLPLDMPTQLSLNQFPPGDASFFSPSLYSDPATVAFQAHPRVIRPSANSSNSKLSPTIAKFDEHGFLDSIRTPSPSDRQFTISKNQRSRLSQRQALRYGQLYTSW